MIGSISFCTGLASAKTLVAAVFFRTFFNEAVAGRLYTPARLYYSFFGLLPRMKRGILRGIMRPIVFFPLLLVLATLAGFGSAARPAPQHEAEFKRLAAQIQAQRQSGQEENASLFEYALSLLDNMALTSLNVPAEPNLEVINTQFALLVEHQPAVGEEYTVYRLGGRPRGFALVANFGVSGPSAVRVYSAFAAPRFHLIARIDRFTQKDFFDDYLALVPVEAAEPLFVTVAGRTDELHSGAFTAWRLSGEKVRPAC